MKTFSILHVDVGNVRGRDAAHGVFVLHSAPSAAGPSGVPSRQLACGVRCRRGARDVVPAPAAPARHAAPPAHQGNKKSILLFIKCRALYRWTPLSFVNACVKLSIDLFICCVVDWYASSACTASQQHMLSGCARSGILGSSCVGGEIVARAGDVVPAPAAPAHQGNKKINPSFYEVQLHLSACLLVV